MDEEAFELFLEAARLDAEEAVRHASCQLVPTLGDLIHCAVTNARVKAYESLLLVSPVAAMFVLV